MGSPPNICNEICQAIKYYTEHVEAISTGNFHEEDVNKLLGVWFEAQTRLAWHTFYDSVAKVSGKHLKFVVS